MAVFDQAGPVWAFLEGLFDTFAPARLGHVEDQQAVRLQGDEYLLEQPPQRPLRVTPVEEIIEHFPQSRDRSTRRCLKFQEGRDVEGRFRDSLPSNLDHGWRQVHGDHLIACLGECFCPDAAAAAQVHYEAIVDAVLSEQVQEVGGRTSGEIAEAGVVDVGEIVLVGVGVWHNQPSFWARRGLFYLARRNQKMQWRHQWSERPPRPKVHWLSAERQQDILAKMTKEIAKSPILSGFGLQVRFLRGRFYVELPLPSGNVVWGRITPVANELLLEHEWRSWNEIARGTPQKLIKTIAGDTRGTFHGLGSLDSSLRKAGQGLTRLAMKIKDNTFVYGESGEGCSVQEALFHYFGLPIEIIAQPRLWYSYHRTPHIAEGSKDRTRVLVRFSAFSLSGSFGGTCLYAQRDGELGVLPDQAEREQEHRLGGSMAGEEEVEGVVDHKANQLSSSSLIAFMHSSTDRASRTPTHSLPV